MHNRLQEVTDEIVSARNALQQSYDPERLYNFRVAARRIRSILKQIDSHRSRLLRKAWGGLAAVTGDARDWDVFLATSETVLAPSEQRNFEAINRDRVANARENALSMINSSLLERHLREWHEYLEHAEDTGTAPGPAQDALAHALGKAEKRFHAAQALETDHNWHRYRIAVKEVRYLAEAYPAIRGAAQLAESCKARQTLLGEWHDSVVQLNLLEELPPAEVHDLLATRIRDRNSSTLSNIRSLPPIAQPE